MYRFNRASRPFDPEGMISQAEVDAGMTYTNSRRSWPEGMAWLQFFRGELSADQVLDIAPRKLVRRDP